MPSDKLPTPEEVKALIKDDCLQLVRLRGAEYREVLKGHTAQCRDNLRDSLGTTEEGYWRFRLRICDEMLLEGAT